MDTSDIASRRTMRTIFEVDDLRQLRACVTKSLMVMGISVPKIFSTSSGSLSRKSKRLQTKSKDKSQGTSSIFGLPICDVPSDFIDGCGYVPRFLVDAATFIEGNIETVGLFRKTGSVHRQKELRRIIENGGSVKCAKLVDDVANLVKQFLRELPEPLITPNLEGHFMKALEIEESDLRMKAIFYLCLLLPLGHLGTLRYFTLLLSRIVQHSTENKMDCTNLALVITPNIMGSCSDSRSLLQDERHLSIQTSLVEMLINNSAGIGVISDQLEELIALEPSSLSYIDSDSENVSMDKSSSRKKRRSGSLQGMMSSIEQNLRSWRSSKKTSVDFEKSNHSVSDCNNPLSPSASGKTPVLRKRKAEDDPLGLSKKKMRTIMKGLPQQSLLSAQAFDVSTMSTSFGANATFPASRSMSAAMDNSKDESAYVFSSASFTQGQEQTKKRFPSPFRNKLRRIPSGKHSAAKIKSNSTTKSKSKIFRILSVNHDGNKANELRSSVTSSRKNHKKTNSSPGRVLDGEQLKPDGVGDSASIVSDKDVCIVDDKSDISNLAENLQMDLFDHDTASVTSPDPLLDSEITSACRRRSYVDAATPTKALIRRGRPNTPTNGLHPSLKKKYCHDQEPVVKLDAKSIDELNSHVEVIVCNALDGGTMVDKALAHDLLN